MPRRLAIPRPRRVSLGHDALRLARQAATADVEVTLDVTPGVPHVFQAYHAILDEGAAALDRAGRLLSSQLEPEAKKSP